MTTRELTARELFELQFRAFETADYRITVTGWVRDTSGCLVICYLKEELGDVDRWVYNWPVAMRALVANFDRLYYSQRVSA